MWTIAFGVFVFVALNYAARAQSAEDTVVFMMFGIEDNLEFVDVEGGRWVYRKVEEYKWTNVRIKDKNKPARELTPLLTAAKNSNCKYVVNLLYPMASPPITYSFEFSRLRDYRAINGPDETRILVEGENLVYDTLFRETEHKWDHEVNVAARRERLEKAAAYFRKTFCQGLAY